MTFFRTPGQIESDVIIENGQTQNGGFKIADIKAEHFF